MGRRAKWSVCKVIRRVLLGSDAPGCVPPPQRTLPVRLRRRALPGTPLPAHPTPPFHRQTTSPDSSGLEGHVLKTGRAGTSDLGV